MKLLNEQHYIHHVLRMPVADWPDPVVRAFAHINPAIYVSMQGPSELGISADASLAHGHLQLRPLLGPVPVGQAGRWRLMPSSLGPLHGHVDRRVDVVQGAHPPGQLRDRHLRST